MFRKIIMLLLVLSFILLPFNSYSDTVSDTSANDSVNLYDNVSGNYYNTKILYLFDLPPLPANALITSAKFYVWAGAVMNGSATGTFYAAYGLTWASSDSVATLNGLNFGSSLSSWTDDVFTGGYASFDMTQTVSNAYDASATTISIQLKTSDYNNTPDSKKICDGVYVYYHLGYGAGFSSENLLITDAPTGTNPPYVEITYDVVETNTVADSGTVGFLMF